MAFRFRRSLKILPGVRINFSRGGTSLSLGGRGGSVTFGPRGTYANVGLPGTGLSYRSRIDAPARGRSGDYEQRRRERLRTRVDHEHSRLEASRRGEEARSDVQWSLLENGALAGTDGFGAPLTRADWRRLWETQGHILSQWLDQKRDEINGDVELLTGIHLDTPSPDSEPVYEPLEFDEPEPVRPPAPTIPPRPERRAVEPLSFWRRLSKRVRARHAAQRLEAERAHRAAVEAWTANKRRAEAEHERALRAWETMTTRWRRSKTAFEHRERQRAEAFAERIRHDTGIMAETLELALQALSWPRETRASYDLLDDGQTVWLDVDLPEIEDLPQRVAVLAVSGRKLNIRRKGRKRLRREYATHVHGIALRLAGTVLATLPTAETVVVSGVSQRLDPATGRINDDYLFSVRFTRDRFENIDFDNLHLVDPVAAIEAFEHRRKMTATGIFRPVEPFTPDSSLSFGGPARAPG